MKIFVSASWKDRKVAKDLMDFLENNGHTITERWYKHEKIENYVDYAIEDYTGVKECDAYVMFHSGFRSGGKYVELGMAIALGKRIITCGTRLKTVFRAYVDRHISGSGSSIRMFGGVLKAL
jgi:nucleoside 2-deoxyribosyltransferase